MLIKKQTRRDNIWSKNTASRVEKIMCNWYGHVLFVDNSRISLRTQKWSC